jgi:GT2 family glycosyltransferase
MTSSTPVSALPEVSVVVVTLDGREMLPACLDALRDQACPAPRMETLVFDNGSQDGSVEWLETRPDVRLLRSPTNLGFAEPNNRAAQAARGRWLVLLNNDAVPEPGFVDRLVWTAENHHAAAAAACILDETGQATEFGGGGLSWLGLGFQHSSWHPAFREAEEGTRLPFACGGAMAVRRDLFLEAGGFDADYFAYYEDVDLGWRLNLTGHHVVYAPQARVRHRRHATSSRFDDHWRHRHWFKNILQTLVKDAEDLGSSLPAGLAVLQSRVASFHHEAAAARARGDREAAARWLEVGAGAAEGLSWVLENFEHVLDKRRAVQATRAVTDAQLHERFGFSMDFGPDAESWRENALAVQLARLYDPPALRATPAPHVPPPLAGQDLAALRHEIASLRGSLSWRATAPLRALLDVLRGRG